MDDERKTKKQLITELNNLRRRVSQLKESDKKRQQAEETLERERTTFDNIIDLNPYSIAIANTEGRYVRINEAYVNLFGRPSDLSAYCLFEDPFIKRTGMDELYRKLYAGEMKLLRFNEVWYNPHESDPVRFPDVDRCISVVNFPLLNPEGEVEFIVFMVEDITERKTAEQSLKEEREKLVLSLKHKGLTAEVAARLNMSESFEDEEAGLLAILSKTMEVDNVSFYRFDAGKNNLLWFSATGKTLKSQSGAAGSEKISCSRIPELIEKINSGQSFFTFDYKKLTNRERGFFTRRRRISECLILPIRLRGEALGFMSLCYYNKHDWSREETELFKTIADIIANAWERQRQFQARLEAEKEQFEAVKMAEQASRLASIGVMAAGITHEINQPLTTVNLAVDWLKDLDKKSDLILPEFFDEKVGLISKGVKRINEIIEHMRSFWAAPGQTMRRTVDLNEAVKSAVSLLDRQLHSHGIELEIGLLNKPLAIQGNPVHLEQIVTNLVVNSMHALDKTGKDKKKIKIQTIKRKRTAFLIVEDNGTGLPNGTMEKIFNPFYSTKKPGKGTGLGLAIVKRFVDEHRGSITVESEKVEGVAVTIKFPILQQAKA